MYYYLRKLTGTRRTTRSNLQLGLTLAFVAGATNAGGFMAVNQYTSHMSGIVSSMADNLAVHKFRLVLAGLGSVTSFLAGSAYSAILINWGRHHRTHSQYAYPLLWEALLLCCFGLMGSYLELHQNGFMPVTVILLCFIMGLQNAIITKISHAEIRTTHMTGLITDIGIEIGKMLYINSSEETANYKPVRADFQRMGLLASLLGAFFFGGLAGAIGFKYIGYSMTLPLAALLVLLAVVPLIDDIRVLSRILMRHRQHDSQNAAESHSRLERSERAGGLGEGKDDGINGRMIKDALHDDAVTPFAEQPAWKHDSDVTSLTKESEDILNKNGALLYVS